MRLKNIFILPNSLKNNYHYANYLCILHLSFFKNIFFQFQFIFIFQFLKIFSLIIIKVIYLNFLFKYILIFFLTFLININKPE